ncbi:methyltransferase [Rhodococcoides trifolii]|uniref:Methyltransferase n=1 Tax=Rhodococcoides trifolii TaxID=908250 RepID=A0A917LHD1_9NOCA|nr:class I SAM-dependent methyltransferase [Rhodococcus trifolii]GGG23857.1 methyltransferase [Rhodococcus trifolii]
MENSAAYDAIARDYAAHFEGALAAKPFDVAILRSFARSVLSSQRRTAVDVGCGPGDAAEVLAECGLEVQGVDASPVMVEIARTRHPSIDFAVADMSSLPFDDDSFDAVCAWYSIVHTPADTLAAVFDEFRRVLREDGWLLLAFQTNAPTLLLNNVFGHGTSLEFLRHDVDMVQELLMECGFVLHRDAIRTPNKASGETASQAFVVARAADHFAEPVVRRSC